MVLQTAVVLQSAAPGNCGKTCSCGCNEVFCWACKRVSSLKFAVLVLLNLAFCSCPFLSTEITQVSSKTSAHCLSLGIHVILETYLGQNLQVVRGVVCNLWKYLISYNNINAGLVYNYSITSVTRLTVALSVTSHGLHALHAVHSHVLHLSCKEELI